MPVIKRAFFIAAVIVGFAHYCDAAATRWLVYTATQSIDCSGFAGGGKLTTNGNDVFCSNDSTGTVDAILNQSALQNATAHISSGTVEIFSASTATVNNRFQALSPFMVGLSSSVANFTTTRIAGGSLTAGVTYYSKVFPFTSSGRVAVYSPELTTVMTTSSKTISMSWTAIPGAAYYRVTRGTAYGAYDGYYQVTTTTYNDTGASFTGAGSVVPNGENYWGTISGEIRLPANMGSINWIDYNDGLIHGHTTVTSAGEYEMSCGKAGFPAYYFEDGNFLPFLTFRPILGANKLQFNAGVFNTAGAGQIDAFPLSILNNGSDVWDFYASSSVTTHRISAANGTASLPTYSFSSQNNLGMYWIGTDELGFSIGGTKLVDFTPSTYTLSTALAVASTAAFSGPIVGTGSSNIFKGTIDGSSAATGNFAETTTQSLARGSSHAMASNVVTSIATMTYTAGDYTISFGCGYTVGTSATTGATCCVSATANACPSIASAGMVPNSSGEIQIRQGAIFSASDDAAIPGVTYSFTTSGSGTLYLTSQVAFPGGTTNAYGFIQKIRKAH